MLKSPTMLIIIALVLSLGSGYVGYKWGKSIEKSIMDQIYPSKPVPQIPAKNNRR
jgi:hypothetical protein